MSVKLFIPDDISFIEEKTSKREKRFMRQIESFYESD